MKIAINGFGRIGRMVLRSYLENYNGELEIVAINDLTDNATLAHLFKYDSTFGPFKGEVSAGDDFIQINGKKIHASGEKDPSTLPWKDMGVDIVFECTGIFTKKEGASKHLQAGAKRVIISAPAKDEVDATLVMGVNHKSFDTNKHFVISNASCTTNCLAPVVKVLNEKFGIKYGLMNTIHSYTGDQNILDAPHKDLRRARTAGASIIPTTTGAAKAVALVMPEMKGKLHGFALRVPTPNVSCIDLTFQSDKELSVETINQALKEAANGELKGILGYEEKELVSIDYKGNLNSSIIDAKLTQVIGTNFAKIISWYDNEYGYATRMIDLAIYIKQQSK